MALSSSVPVICRHCGGTHDIHIYSSINVSEAPELREKVMDGSIFSWECPSCAKTNYMRYQTLYHDPDQKVMVWLTQGDLELEAKAAAIAQMEEMKAYTLRFVDEPGEFIEKTKIFSAGLDDVVMEMCKYVTKMELGEKEPAKAEALMNAAFKFLKMEGADNEITLAYPMDGQMQMVVIGFNVYEDCRGIVQRNPHMREAATGFCHIDASWLSKYISQ